VLYLIYTKTDQLLFYARLAMLLIAKAPIHGLLLTLFIPVISRKNNSAQLSENNELILGAKFGSV